MNDQLLSVLSRMIPSTHGTDRADQSFHGESLVARVVKRCPIRADIACRRLRRACGHDRVE